MSGSRVVISVESVDVGEVESVVRKLVGAMFLGLGEDRPLGLRIVVSDVSAAMKSAARYLEQEKDDNPIWRMLPSEDFGVDVDLETDFGTIGDACKEFFGDLVAQRLSVELGARTALSIEDGYVPFAVYASGRKVHDFAEEYRRVFAAREWVPRSCM